MQSLAQGVWEKLEYFINSDKIENGLINLYFSKSEIKQVLIDEWFKLSINWVQLENKCSPDCQLFPGTFYLKLIKIWDHLGIFITSFYWTAAPIAPLSLQLFRFGEETIFTGRAM